MGKVEADTNEQEIFSLKFFLIIFSIHAFAAIGLIYYFTWQAFILWILSHFIFITIGASIGLHRYFSHRSFVVKNLYFDIALHAFATLCLQGGPIYWATTHRSHHKHSEKYGDPHSAKRGFLWSHILWLMYERPNGFSYIKSIRYCPDLRNNTVTNFFERYYLKINIFFIFFLFTLCIYLDNLPVFFFLGPIRIVSVWHCTWLINSYAHGAKFFGSETKIKNSYLLCLLVGGDGEHKFHHENASSPKHSDKENFLDYGYALLVLFNRMGLIKIKK